MESMQGHCSEHISVIKSFRLILIVALVLAGSACSTGDLSSTTPALGSADTTPPSVISVSPAAGATNVPVNSSMQINFNEALLTSSVNATTVSISGVAGTVSLSGQTVMLTPTSPSPLAPSLIYTVTVLGGSSGVKDLAGNPLSSNYSWTFTTGAAVSGGYPCDGFYQPGFTFVTGLDNSPIPSIARPAKGVPITEPTYKTCLVRISDAASEPPSTFARNDYSRRQAFNADNSKILVYAFDGKWHLYDARTMQYLKQLTGPGGDAEPQWHPTDPNSLYYIPNKGGMVINKVDISTDVTAVVANFTGRLPWPTAARVSTKAEVQMESPASRLHGIRRQFPARASMHGCCRCCLPAAAHRSPPAAC